MENLKLIGGGKKSLFSDEEVQVNTLERCRALMELPSHGDLRLPWPAGGCGPAQGGREGPGAAVAPLELAVLGGTGGSPGTGELTDFSFQALRWEPRQDGGGSQGRRMGRRERDEDKVAAEPRDTWAKQRSWMGAGTWSRGKGQEKGTEGRRC